MHDLLPEEDRIRAYLDRVEESGVLGRGARRPALLEYLLRTEAANEGDKIKAYSIGIDVFDKPKDFDPTTDSSVRVEVGRLRTAIALFEAGEWADTAIKVDIPVGTYRPEITERFPETDSPASNPPDAGALEAAPVPQKRVGYLPVVALLGFVAILVFGGLSTLNWRTSPPLAGAAITVTVEEFGGDALGKELSLLVKDSFSSNTVVALSSQSPSNAGDGHFVVRGIVTKLNDKSRVSVELTNLGTKELAWNHFFILDPSQDLQKQLDIKLNGELETRLLGEAKVLLEKRDVTTLTPEQLFVLSTWVSGPAIGSLDWEVERVRLMRLALDQDPDFGPAHSVLADKYAFLANVHPDWDTQENLDLAQFHAARAVELSPLDSNAMFNVAQSYWHLGRHADSQRIFKRVTELDNSNSLARFFAYLMPYWCADVPDEVMDWAHNFDQNLSSDDPIRWIVLTWIATLHTNRAEYDLALEAIADAAHIFQVGYTYMAHAMLLVQAGKPDAARAAIQRQRSNWPGITAAHYAGSTVPRLCSEQPKADRFVKDFSDLTSALQTQ